MPKRVDANQPDIVAGLRAVGATVLHLHELGRGVPDILVGHRGNLYLFELKSERGHLTPAQQRWHNAWRDSVAVIRSLEDALRALGVEVSDGD